MSDRLLPCLELVRAIAVVFVKRAIALTGFLRIVTRFNLPLKSANPLSDLPPTTDSLAKVNLSKPQ